jgi:hypothetical protein
LGLTGLKSCRTALHRLKSQKTSKKVIFCNVEPNFATVIRHAREETPFFAEFRNVEPFLAIFSQFAARASGRGMR